MKMNLKKELFLFITGICIVKVPAQINLAPQGVAIQLTDYPERYANLAIEGPANNKWDDGCSVTALDQTFAWWGLQLPAVAHMTNIVIYYREFFAQRMDGFSLYLHNGTADQSNVSGLCYTDKDSGVPAITQNITCSMLAKNMYFINRRSNATCFVELCYVAIYGCWKGSWGLNCTESCPANCINQNCYPETGFCVWGCDSHNCLHSKCDVQSGVCTDGCVIGRAGQYCNKRNLAFTGKATQSPPNINFPARWSIDANRTSSKCSKTTGVNAYLEVDTTSLSVVIAIHLTFRDTEPIPSGNYAVYCSNTSSSRSGSHSIELYKYKRPTGYILVHAVCRYIMFVPPVVNGMRNIDICEIEIAGCPVGNYGDACKNVCYCIEPCDLDTGRCMSGCLNGWMGEKCDQACITGYFGNDCSRKCSENCVSQHCHHVTGECIGGCKEGWEGYNCTQECNLGFFGFNCSQSCPGCVFNLCDKITGYCSNISECEPGYVKSPYCNQECDDWYFGINCASKCNCLQHVCKTSNGKCSAKGCKKGWYGFACDKECDPGFYGFNCKEQCATCFNRSCERVEGNCSYDCIDSYEGVKCQTLVNGNVNKRVNKYSASIGGGIGALVVIIVIVVVLIIIYRRRSKPKREQFIRKKANISRRDENSYCNHMITLETDDTHLNVNSAQSSTLSKPPLSYKKESETRSIEEIDEYPEEHDDEEEEEEYVYNNIPSEQTIIQCKIPIANLKKLIKTKKKEDGFKNEYELLPKGLLHAHVEGSKEENKVKNRFLTTWPYDHSRVVLNGDIKHDYINASYIGSYKKEKAYIASQGPKKNTIRDFWQMVWQDNVCKIVMVTKLEEERRKKCEQYWPKTVNKVTVVDNYRLTMTEEKYNSVYVYRLISVHNKTNRKERTVRHFHFTEWPDHGVPDSIKLAKFYRKVKSENCEQLGPLVVHCSAGVGRTGAFIALDALYEHSRKTGYLDIMEYVQMMRKDRMNMIQTHEQYEIVFETLLELLTVPDTSIQTSDFCEYIQQQESKTLPKNQTMYSEEFQRLRALRPSYFANDFTAANDIDNKPKNSSTTVLAHNNYRPYLMSYGQTRSDYINAVIIPGLSVESKLFVTQCPLVETVIDFWTLMYDHSSRIVVLLDPGNEDAPLWLDKKEMLQFDDFRITKETENAQEEIQLTLYHTKNKEQISIYVFTAADWTISSAPPSPDYMLDLLQRVEKCWEIQRVPITVVCSDGCSKSGLFVALKLVLEKMQIDEEIDIFQVVRELQKRRPEFLVDVDQYEYCYRCIRVLLEEESLYANVKSASNIS
ncbi:receptor-type tyrosine-protein phosphatase mu-like [Mytilus edulis]|uniref:receptor-type tyrosine-protein phosphatase mu-like n=1 Tax=Mytilus edulis TaxID=6550 RepID=UPI0039EFC43F